MKRTIAGLTQDQLVRKHMDPEGAKQIDDYVAKIEALLDLNRPFHVVRFLSSYLLDFCPFFAHFGLFCNLGHELFHAKMTLIKVCNAFPDMLK